MFVVVTLLATFGVLTIGIARFAIGTLHARFASRRMVAICRNSPLEN